MGKFNEGKSPSIERLSPWHRTMVRACVAGVRPSDLAKHFGMTKAHVSRIIGSPAFISELKRLEEGAEERTVELSEELEAMRETALLNIDSDLNMPVGDDAKLIALRQKASFGILDFTLDRKDGLVPKEGTTNLTLMQQINIAGMSREELAQDVMSLIKGG